MNPAQTYPGREPLPALSAAATEVLPRIAESLAAMAGQRAAYFSQLLAHRERRRTGGPRLIALRAEHVR
jgi:hypothetical protein